MHFRRIAFAAGLLASAASFAWAQETADRIFTGGPVLTMNDAQPRAGAVAVKDGRIIAVGTPEEIAAFQGEGTVVTDLAGRTLIPGFVDAHGHIFGGGIQALSANLLAPPDGDVTDIASLQQTLRDWMAENRELVEAANLIIGFGYDNSPAGRAAPSDARPNSMRCRPSIPIYIVHQSGHLGAANTKAIEIAGHHGRHAEPAGRRHSCAMPRASRPACWKRTRITRVLGEAPVIVDRERDEGDR